MPTPAMNGNQEQLGGQLVIVRVEDEINQALTGHDGCRYESPPQPREQALTLARVLLGYTGEVLNGAERWSCPIAGGRRTVTVVQAAPERRDVVI